MPTLADKMRDFTANSDAYILDLAKREQEDAERQMSIHQNTIKNIAIDTYQDIIKDIEKVAKTGETSFLYRSNYLDKFDRAIEFDGLIALAKKDGFQTREAIDRVSDSISMSTLATICLRISWKHPQPDAEKESKLDHASNI